MGRDAGAIGMLDLAIQCSKAHTVLNHKSDEPTSAEDRLLLNDLKVRHLPTVVEERL